MYILHLQRRSVSYLPRTTGPRSSGSRNPGMCLLPCKAKVWVWGQVIIWSGRIIWSQPDLISSCLEMYSSSWNKKKWIMQQLWLSKDILVWNNHPFLFSQMYQWFKAMHLPQNVHVLTVSLKGTLTLESSSDGPLNRKSQGKTPYRD